MPWKVTFENDTSDPKTGTLTARFIETQPGVDGKPVDVVLHSYSRRATVEGGDLHDFVHEARASLTASNTKRERVNEHIQRVETALNAQG